MNFDDYIARGLIEKIDVVFDTIKESIQRSKKDISTAKATLIIDEEWTYTISYHAMLRAGRALMLSYSYRPKGKDQHKTIVEFCSRILGEKFRVLASKFNRMRIKRHEFIYSSLSISKTESEYSLNTAEELLEQISLHVKKQNPQLELL
jgi:uncharacterized protein (UPF0332 family)